MTAVLELRTARKVYPGTPPVVPVAGITVSVRSGEFVAVTGPSGSGKTTLLNLAAGLDRPTSGSVRICGLPIEAMSDRELSGLRAHRVGVVFQRFYLLEHCSVLDNVAAGLIYRGVRAGERRRGAAVAVDRVGLTHRARHRAGRLSGGERQRVAIARALVGRPAVLLADEPTGNLDTASGAALLALLRDVNADGTTIVVVTHDPVVAAAADRRIRLRDGHVAADSGAAVQVSGHDGGGRS